MTASHATPARRSRARRTRTARATVTIEKVAAGDLNRSARWRPQTEPLRNADGEQDFWRSGLEPRVGDRYGVERRPLPGCSALDSDSESDRHVTSGWSLVYSLAR